MKIKLLTSVVFDNMVSVGKGQEIEINAKQGRGLVKSGIAIEIKPPKEQSKEKVAKENE